MYFSERLITDRITNNQDRTATLTCSSFIIRDRSCGLLLPGSSTLSIAPAECPGGPPLKQFRGSSQPVLSNRAGPGLLQTSPGSLKLSDWVETPIQQLLLVEVGSGAKLELNESSQFPGSEPQGERFPGDSAERFPAESTMSGDRLRITPARLLLGIHRARKSTWEKCSPSEDDMLSSMVRLANLGLRGQIIVTGLWPFAL